ncbi:HTH-type transcriptional activator RhaS [Paenibacillus konkukensis]|uniref:HTH-type transcriptional activator RhaS n=1 Tax=Paenibacillus konkukensis TaxID=2020716 RepID=A0ABY4RLZ0_9BACL|nr:AraC family transcriptional regulator [Paenibacillus konkukensis]UQZ82603.1 HTH-type transcriptional activator RhaS [Paenibacillus konkukensis]
MSATRQPQTKTAQLNEIHSRIVSANFYPFKPGQHVGPRLPYVHLFIYISAGRGTMKIGEDVWAAETGDLYYIAPGVSHTFIAAQDDPMVHASVYADLLSPSTPKQKGDPQLNCHNAGEYDVSLCAARVQFADADGIALPVRVRAPRGAAWLEPYLAVIEAYPEQGIGDDALLRSLFETFLVRYVRFARKPYETWYDPRIGRMVDWLRHTETADPCVKEWAGKLGISVAYLYELFRKQTGTSPQTYLLKCRLDKAKTYLRETNMPITEIAYTLGFSSPHYFARQFGKHAQESASEYRRRFRGLS